MVQRNNKYLITGNEQAEVRLFFDSDVEEESPYDGQKVEGDIWYFFYLQISVKVYYFNNQNVTILQHSIQRVREPDVKNKTKTGGFFLNKVQFKEDLTYFMKKL